MHSFDKALFFTVLMGVLALVSACQPISALNTTPAAAKTFTDPFAYCAAAGTIDSADDRYIGEKLPKSITKRIVGKGIVSADAPAKFVQHAIWRCMDSHVWICHYGANLPCDSKTDASTTPNTGIEEFCKSNPSSDFIPAFATGRETIYEWSCKYGKAVVGKQIVTVDAQGFDSQIWHELTAP